MRILILTPRFPLPTIKGDKLRTWQMINSLSTRHDVTLLCYGRSRSEKALISEIEKVCNIVTVPFNLLRGGFELCKGIGGTVPYQVHLFNSPAIRDYVEDLRSWHDVVHLSTIRMAGNLPVESEGKLVVDFIDALSLNFKRRADNADFPIKQLALVEYDRLVHFEKKLADSADLAMAVSPVDASTISAKVKVVPLIIDIDEFVPPDSSTARHDIIFSGNMSYSPNVNGAIYMAREILPQIVERFPDIKLRLVGVNPHPKVQMLASRHIEVTGFVESIANELRSAAVAVCPLTSGSGLQNKILEAMACATPVVSTSMANAGVGAEGGKEILIADNPVDFAGKVISLLEDKDRAYELGMTGRKFIEEKFDPESIRKLILDLYSQLECKSHNP